MEPKQSCFFLVEIEKANSPKIWRNGKGYFWYKVNLEEKHRDELYYQI